MHFRHASEKYNKNEIVKNNKNFKLSEKLSHAWPRNKPIKGKNKKSNQNYFEKNSVDHSTEAITYILQYGLKFSYAL